MAVAVEHRQKIAAVSPRSRPRDLVVFVAGAMLLLSAVRAWTGADDLTSFGTFSAALRLAVPIGFAGLGAIYAERCGVVNIGIEGMMILGTWFGAWGGVQYGPWWGVVLGIAGGALGGLVHAIATVQFGVNHIVSGVAINILGAGVARFLSVVAWAHSTVGGGATQSPRVQGDIPHASLPFLGGGTLFGWHSPDVLGWFTRHDWFFVSDVAGFLRAFCADVSWLTVMFLALIPITWWVLWRTKFGLELRSTGENPAAAESLGVPVYRMKYAGVVLSGALAGLGGAFLVLEAANIYREGQTNGRGFIALAALIFGNWRPVGVALGSALFGFSDALQLRQGSAVHALLLFVALGALLFAGRALYQRRWKVAAVLAAFAFAFWLYYVTTDQVLVQFVFFTPHLTTLLVLSFATQRLRMPAADGLVYRKGQVQ